MIISDFMAKFTPLANPKTGNARNVPGLEAAIGNELLSRPLRRPFARNYRISQKATGQHWFFRAITPLRSFYSEAGALRGFECG